MNDFWIKFRLIVWKTYKIRKRHYLLTVCEIILPILLFLIVGYGRTQVSTLQKTKIEATYTQPKESDLIFTDYFTGSTQVLYYPCTDFTDSLLQKVQMKLALENHVIQGFDNENNLKSTYSDIMMNSTYPSFMVIKFKVRQDKSPIHLEYSIGNYKNDIKWETQTFFNTKCDEYIPDIGSDNYFRYGFLAMQMALDISFVEMVTEKDLEFGVAVQEFPYPEHTDYSGLTLLFRSILPFLTIFSFMLLCPSVLRRIVEEKSTGIKELMKLMGLKSWMLWCGWLLHAVMIGTFSICILTIILKFDLFGAEFPLIEHTNGFILFLFLFSYFCSSIVFLFAISTLFSKPTSAMFLGIFIWLLTYMVTFSIPIDCPQCNIFYKYISFVFPNSALEYGFHVISMYENREKGIQWDNLFNSAINDEFTFFGTCKDISLGFILIMFLIDIILYGLLTLTIDSYNPGPFGIRKPFGRFWIKFFQTSEAESIDNEHLLKNEGIHIRNLKKTFKNTAKNAVDGLNMFIPKNQVTVLLGHNGAGKTTTMHVLTGILPSTSGSVSINGYDIKRDKAKIQNMMGLCTQHNLLFTDLTVEEHLIFFAMLKGKTAATSKEESLELLSKLNLYEKRNELPKNLSGGMKRKLNLGLALIGGSEVLILDEPTSSLDPEGKRNVWDLILNLRKGRTILITTHCMQEADILGDQIAIMDQGKLLEYDTPMNLKRKFGKGYHLSISLHEQQANHHRENIKNIIISYIKALEKDAIVMDSSENELEFKLPSINSAKFPSLFKNLESKQQEFEIAGVGITVPSIEDVFLDVCSQPETAFDLSSESKKIVNEPSLSKTNSFHKLWKQMVCLWKKKHLYRNSGMKKSPLLVLFILLLSMILTNSFCDNIINEPPLSLALNVTYGNTTVYQSPNGDSTIVKEYEEIVRLDDGKIETVRDVKQVLVDRGKNNIEFYKYELIVAAEFNEATDSNTLTAFYSNVALHGAPISLNLLMNAIVKNVTENQDYKISITNEPINLNELEYITKQGVKIDQETGLKLNALWAVVIPLGFMFFVGTFLSFPLSERVTNIKMLQYFSGANCIVYWFVTFIHDIIAYTSIIGLILFITFGTNYFLEAVIFPRSFEELYVIFSMFVCYGIGAIPFAYCISYFKSTISGAIVSLVLWNCIVGTTVVAIVYVLELMNEDYYMNIAEIIKTIFFLFPHFAFSYAMLNYSTKSIENHNWLIQTAGMRKEFCTYKENPCCSEDNVYQCATYQSYYYGNHKISPALIFLLADGLLLIICLCIMDSNMFKKVANFKNVLYKYSSKKKFNNKSDIFAIDSSYNYVANNLMKIYSFRNALKNIFAVKNVSFGVKKGECFGLLGVNGAGKTTTFKMLTTEESLTDGQVSINNNINISNTEKYLQNLGYCPQDHVLNESISACELLKCFATLRGIEHVEEEVETIIDQVGLTDYKNIPCGLYSGGNKRKLNIAIALVGNPEIVFLDEPTNSVDPISRRKLWNLLTTLKKSKSGTSFVLTSHSMEECEYLCDRLSIMVDGEIRCTGGLAELKHSNRQGYTVKLKLRREFKTITDDENLRQTMYDHNLTELKQKFFNTFNSIIKDEHEGLLHYQLLPEKPGTMQCWKWSELFGELQDIKNCFCSILEDYSISDTTLEELFLSISKNTKVPELKREISRDSGYLTITAN